MIEKGNYIWEQNKMETTHGKFEIMVIGCKWNVTYKMN